MEVDVWFHQGDKMTADQNHRLLLVTAAPMASPRLEDGLELHCCGQPCKLAGNLALRGAGSLVTRLAYECVRCFRRLQIVDAWDELGPEELAAIDETP